MRDLRRELEDFDDWPAAWRPRAGDVLVGEVLRYDVGHTPFGPVRTCTLRTDDGARVAARRGKAGASAISAARPRWTARRPAREKIIAQHNADDRET